MSADQQPVEGADSPSGNTVTPLEGEAGIPSVTQSNRSKVSRKDVLAVALFVISLIALSAVWVNRVLSGDTKDADEASKRTASRPTAAAAEPRRLDMTLPAAPIASAAVGRMIPAILPLPEEARPVPIPLRQNQPAKVAPEDAPAVLLSSRAAVLTGKAQHQRQPQAAWNDVPPNPDDPFDSTKRNLEAYQHQLQGLLETLTKSAELASGQPAATTALAHGANSVGGSTANRPAATGLFGGQLQGSATPKVTAGVLGNRSLTLPKGTAFTCALKTRLVSAASGFVSCQVQRNVFSDDGRVLLIERGSHLDGEYRSATVRPGTVRVPVLWTRVRTPLGVTVDIESPATGPLGESGIDGHVDNRWTERIGAALLLSLIDDSVKLIVQSQAADGQGDTFVLPSTTSSSSKLAEKVLDSTINIPPLIYQHQGAIIGIYVARDVDFSLVYGLKAVPR
jgi:type IV secretion system protein VirB10